VACVFWVAGCARRGRVGGGLSSSLLLLVTVCPSPSFSSSGNTCSSSTLGGEGDKDHHLGGEGAGGERERMRGRRKEGVRAWQRWRQIEGRGEMVVAVVAPVDAIFLFSFLSSSRRMRILWRTSTRSPCCGWRYSGDLHV
jgi:hypothetical protein